MARRRLRLGDLTPKQQVEAKRQMRGAGNPDPRTHAQPGPKNAHPNAHPSVALYAHVRLTYHCFRVRFLDWENVYTKHITDGLVEAGLFPDDEPHIVIEQPRLIQTKVKTTAEERVVILVEEMVPTEGAEDGHHCKS